MKPTTQAKRPPTRLDIANFYADVLMTLAEESFAYKSWRGSLANLSRLVESDEMAALIRNPSISKQELGDYVDDLLVKGDATTEERRLVERLISRGDFALVPLIRDQFIEMSNKALGISETHVVSAKPLTLREEIDLKKILRDRFNVKAKITKSVDESLIAGYIIHIDGQKIDQSTRGYRERQAKAHKAALG